MSKYWKFSNQLGIFFVILFAICFIWYFIRPVNQLLHMQAFQIAYFGFKDMNLASFILGAIQSYIWAYIAVALWYLAKYISGSKR